MRWFGWLRKKRTPAEKDPQPDRKPELKTECPTCGYVGDESEFLTDDPWDTICPKCGEDTPIYEM